MAAIIDAHSHVGDILYPNGGRIIERKGIKKKIIFDPISIWQLTLNRNFGMGTLPYRIFLRWIINAEKERNFTASRENARKTMDEAGITFTVCLPVPPYLYFSDVSQAAKKDPGLIPYTGVDFSDFENLENKLTDDVNQGAKGLKLHPIIQKVSFKDERMMRAVQIFMKFDLPILFHAGVSNYYSGEEKNLNIPQYGKISEAREMVSAYPEAKFIVGHAGMFDYKDVIRLLSGYDNVWVDTSLQSPGSIRELIMAFGDDKVLYASDWPFGSRKAAVKAVRVACKGDSELERKILYNNAAELMRLR